MKFYPADQGGKQVGISAYWISEVASSAKTRDISFFKPSGPPLRPTNNPGADAPPTLTDVIHICGTSLARFGAAVLALEGITRRLLHEVSSNRGDPTTYTIEVRSGHLSVDIAEFAFLSL